MTGVVTKTEIDTPALLIDLPAMERNLETMSKFFEGRPASLRPHAKTHKTPILAHKQLEAGAIGITCAKLGEAEAMVQAGIRNVLIANQVVGKRKIERLINLSMHSDIIVAVDSEQNVADLAAAASDKGTRLNVIIEVEVGMQRCGVVADEKFVALARQINDAESLRFRGIMGYEGHAVATPGFEERKAVGEKANAELVRARDLLIEAGLPVEIVSAGGTGTYNIAGAFPGITEVQAGSYILMDTMYREVVPEFECALTLLTTVISLPRPGIAICDAGLKALSRGFGMPEVKDRPDITVAHLSEEHGKLELGDGADVEPGDKLELIISHVCEAVNLHDAFHAVRDDRLEGVWPIAARGKGT